MENFIIHRVYTWPGISKSWFLYSAMHWMHGLPRCTQPKKIWTRQKNFLVPESLSWETALGKANMYLETIEKCGGSEYLWDSWCDYIAALYPKKFKNGEHVSQCHVDYLISRKD